MKARTIFLFFFVLLAGQKLLAQKQQKTEIPDNQTALVLIDIQMFYFEGGQMPLHQPEKASRKAGELLQTFRSKGLEVIHIRHDAADNAQIHPVVAPIEGEKVITKRNLWKGTFHPKAQRKD